MTTATPEAPTVAAKPKRLLRLPDVLARVPLGRTAWYQLVKDGNAPPSIKLGGAVVWREADIDAFIDAGGVWPVGNAAGNRPAEGRSG